MNDLPVDGGHLDDAEFINRGTVMICHGPPRCMITKGDCQFCFVVSSGDDRTTDEIIRNMEVEH